MVDFKHLIILGIESFQEILMIQRPLSRYWIKSKTTLIIILKNRYMTGEEPENRWLRSVDKHSLQTLENRYSLSKTDWTQKIQAQSGNRATNKENDIVFLKILESFLL